MQLEASVSDWGHLALVDDSIIVTLPSTHYRIVYRQGFDTWLVASDTCNDVNFPFRTPTFRARAWTAGTDKARELGWLM